MNPPDTSVAIDRLDQWNLPAVYNHCQQLQGLAPHVRQMDTVHDCQPQMDQLVLGYLHQAFRGVGLADADLQQCARSEADCREVLADKGLPAGRVWWLRILSQIYCRRIAGANHATPGQLVEKLKRQLPFYAVELSLIQRVGENLADLVRTEGTAGIVQILFADDVMTRWYTEGLTFSPLNTLATEAVRQLQSAGVSPLRILEVGAGTGGLTYHLLQTLAPQHTQYVFTDVGGFFLRAAKRRFSQYDFVEYRKFDLERTVAEQNFETSSFDLVVANNVLHDTTNLRFTIENVASLLAPGGMLLLVELTSPQIWWHMCFGSLEGWWRFKDDPTDFRQEVMLLSKHDWPPLLADYGFHTECLSDGLPGHTANSLYLSQRQCGGKTDD